MVPRHVTLGAHRIRISTDPSLAERGANGETYRESLEVRIFDRLAPTIEREVVIHELLHAAWHQTGLRSPGPTADLEEEIIGSLAPLVLELLRRNRPLVDYLTG
jgi:hypothetical protein